MAGQREQIEDNQKIVNAGVKDAADSFKKSVDASLESLNWQRERVEENQKTVNAGVKDAADDFKSSVDTSLESLKTQQTALSKQRLDLRNRRKRR